jgi:uncharacterized membrane-anchored protein
MQSRHLPRLGLRFWAALCLASIFGANMGDFFAHDLGLGHARGLPFLALGLAIVFLIERFDRLSHEAWYWLAIILIRTAATNIGDLMSGDFKLPRLIGMAVLTVLLVAVAAIANRISAPSRDSDSSVLRADGFYWAGMLVAGALGTVMGDYFSHNLRLGDARGALVLSAVLAVLFVVGARGRVRRPALFWTTIVLVRAAGTCAGDLLAQRGVLGLATSTLVTGLAFVVLLLAWRRQPVSLA